MLTYIFLKFCLWISQNHTSVEKHDDEQHQTRDQETEGRSDDIESIGIGRRK